MSDSDSEDEFLSADEGDYEDRKQKTTMEEEEVDEIMDLLMNKEQSSSKNERTIPDSKEIEKSTNNLNNCDDKKGDSKNDAESSDNKETQKLCSSILENNKPLEASSDKDENNAEEIPSVSCLEDMIEESLRDEPKIEQTESQSADNDQKQHKTKEIEVETMNQETLIIAEVSPEQDSPPININIEQKSDGVDETQPNQQETLLPDTKSEHPNEPLEKLDTKVSDAVNDIKTIEETKEKLSTMNSENEKEIPHDKPDTNDISEGIEDTRHDLDDLDLDDDSSDGEEIVNKQPENVEDNVIEEVQEQQEQSPKNIENKFDNETFDVASNELPENEKKEPSGNQTNDSCDSGISVNNDDAPNMEDNKQLPEKEETKRESHENGNKLSDDTTSGKTDITPTDPQEETKEEGVEDFDEDNDWGDWGNEENIQEKEIKSSKATSGTTNEETKQSATDKSTVTSEPPKQTPIVTPQSKDDWGWDSWADDFLVQAAGKVSNMLESVEGQLGIPDPTKMAHVVSKEEQPSSKFSPTRAKKVETKAKDLPKTTKQSTPTQQVTQQQQQQPPQPQPGGSSWFGGFGASLSGLVQNTSTDLVSGGIGALEFIGKKTVDMLSDGDPGLRQTRDALVGKKNKANLSALIREAKETSEKNPNLQAKSSSEITFNDYFEKFQGNCNLDALEMLSNECEAKLERILRLQSNEARQETTQLLTETKEKYSLPEDFEENESNSDFKKDLFATTKQLKMKVTCSKLLNTWTKLKDKSKDSTSIDPKECYTNTLSGLAELTSRCVEFYRKVADMLLTIDMQAKDLAVQRASALHSISVMFSVELTHLSNSFAQQIAGNSDAKNIVTDIYLEGSNCNSIVRDCHDLVLPILQCCIVK